MPQHKSAAKRMRTSAARREKNRPRLARVRKAVKNVRAAADKETASARLIATTSLLDRTASKGTIHKNRANRLKSRLARSVNSMSS